MKVDTYFATWEEFPSDRSEHRPWRKVGCFHRLTDARRILAGLQQETEYELLRELGVLRAYSQVTLHGIWLVLPKAPIPRKRQRLPRELPVMPAKARPGQMDHHMEGRAVECHICGDWYRSVGHHVRQVHKISPAEYRQRFGLNRSTPLCSREYSQKCRLKNKRLRLGKTLRSFQFDGTMRPPNLPRRQEGKRNISEAMRKIRD